MNIKPCFFALAAVLLSACANQVTGQKEHKINLATNKDSVSYGIGIQVGENLKMNLKHSGLDSLNMDILFEGLRDGVDSTGRITSDKVNTLVQAYMLAAQKKVLAKKQALADANLAAGKAFMTANGKKPGVVTTKSGLQYEVLQMGKGAKPVATDTVQVNYKGTLLDGTQFDSSEDHGGPATFPVNRVIPGWTEALQLMPVGSRFKLYVPSELAYGERGAGEKIPGNSTLIFEVELLNIKK